MKSATLRVTEIFFSLQGETSRVGLPTVFVRLSGCPLRCRWCDTSYSFEGGEPLGVDEILARVGRWQPCRVTVTGGEPLAQRPCHALLSALCDAGYDVSLETGGALDIGAVDPRVARIVDIKPPASGEAARNRWENLDLLTPRDEVKLVLAGREDYDWAKQIMSEHRLAQRCPVLLSPVHGELEARDLAQWMLQDRLPARLQIQLHKVLWGVEPGR